MWRATVRGRPHPQPRRRARARAADSRIRPRAEVPNLLGEQQEDHERLTSGDEPPAKSTLAVRLEHKRGCAERDQRQAPIGGLEAPLEPARKELTRAVIRGERLLIEQRAVKEM